MDPAVPVGKRGRRPLRRIAIAAALVLSGAPLALNLFLASGPGCRWIAARVQGRTGLECRVAGTTVTPWSGIEIRGLELLQPPPLRTAVSVPLLQAKSIRLSPAWKSWISGRFEVHTIRVDSPAVTIPLELLAEIARPRPGTPPPAAAAPPPVATADTPPAPVSPAPPKPTPQPPTPQAGRTAWLHLRDASLRLVSAARETDIVAITGLSGSIPIAGAPATSALRVAQVSALGQILLTETRSELAWTPPFLTATAPDLAIGTHHCQARCSLALVPGLPLQAEVAMPAQSLALIPLPGGHRLSASGANASARFRGYLLAPASWQGEFAAASTRPNARLAGQDVAFDRGHCVILLRGGALACTDARLIGESASLLGNAALLSDGRLAAVLRVVAPPESLDAISARLFPNIPRPVPTALATPQRAALDIQAFGDIRRIFIRPGLDGPVLTLQP
jgi:hypothetical protein